MALYNHCMRVFSNLPLGETPLVLEDHCQSPVEGGEEALFQLVERWDGEEPTSPILFDPDGDFILLPRPEQVCFQEKEAFSSLSEPTPYPVHVFVHSAVLNTLQSVPDYPHRFQVYLKEGLSNLKSSKASEGQTIPSTSPSKEEDTEPQTVAEAEPITTDDTSPLRSPTETSWFRSFKTKTSSLKRTKETASADTENSLDTISDSAREVSVPLKGGDFIEEDEKASAVSDSDLTLDAHDDVLTDGIKDVLRVSKKKTKLSDEPFPEETSGSLISTIGHYFIPSHFGKHFKSTDSLPPLERSQEPNQDLKHDTISSDQDADISSTLDKSVEENGSDDDECQISQEEIKEEIKGQAQEEGWMRHPILLFKPNTYRTLVNKTLSWKGKSQSLDDLSDPVIASFNVTSHEQKNPQDDVNLLEDSTDESEQINDLEFEHLQDAFSAAKADLPKIKPSKLKFWQLVPYVYLGTIKPNNTEHGLKKATSLDSVVSEPLSPSSPVHEEEGVNFVDTNNNFKKFIIGNQRLHIDVDRLKRFATTGMAEGISSSGQSGTDVKNRESGGILGFVRGAGGRLSALGLSRKTKGPGSAAPANGSKSDAQNSLEQNESGLPPTSSIDLDGQLLSLREEEATGVTADEFDKVEDSSCVSLAPSQSIIKDKEPERKWTVWNQRTFELRSSFRRKSRKPKRRPADSTGTDSRKAELTESDVDISSSNAINEDIDQGQQLELRVEKKSSDIGSVSLESSVTEEKSRFSDFKKKTGQLRTSFRRKLWKDRKLPDRDKSGTESRKDETEVNESATTSINEDIGKGQQLDYRERNASDRPMVTMVTDEVESERSGSVSLASSQSVIKEEDEKKEQEGEGGTKLKNFKKTASHLRSSFRRKLRKEEKLTGDNNGTESRKDETEVNESVTTSINEDIDKDQQLDYGERKASDRFMVTDDERSGSVSVASSQSVIKEEEEEEKKEQEEEEGTKLKNFKKTASHLRSSFRRKSRKEKLTGDNSGTESRKDETEVNESATTSINEDIEKDQQLDYGERKASDRFMVTDDERSGSVSVASSQSVIKEEEEEEKKEQEEEEGTKLKNFKKTASHLRSSFRRKSRKEKLTGDNSGTESRKDETEVNESATTSINEDIEKDQQLDYGERKASDRFMVTDDERSGSVSVASSQSVIKEEEEEEKKEQEEEEGTKLKNFKKTASHLRSSFRRKSRKEKLTGDNNGIESRKEDARETDDVDVTAPTSVSEDIKIDMNVSSGAQLDSREKKLPDIFVATDEVASNENSGSANLVSLQSETKEGKGKTRLTDLMDRTDKLRSSIKRKKRKEEKLPGSKSESGIKEVREADVNISAMAAVSEDNDKDQLSVSTNEESPSTFPDTFEEKSDSCISEAIQSSSEKETGNKVGNFVRGTRERLSLVRRGKKKKDQFLIPETAKQAGKPSEINKALPADDKSEDEEYDVFDNSVKSSGNTEELQFTFKKDRPKKLGRSTSERKLSRRPRKGLRRSESDMQVFYKPRNTTKRRESLDGIGTESSKKVVSEDDVDISSISPVKKDMQKDQLSLTTTQERLPSNFTTIIEGKSDEEKSDLISVLPTSPSTSKEKTETTVGSFVRGTWERLSLVTSGKKKKDQSLKDKQGEWVVVSQGSSTVGDDPVSNEQIDQTSPSAGKEEEESPRDEVSSRKAPSALLSSFRKIGKRRDSSQEEGIGRTLDIAATNDSLARAQSYQHQVDSKRLKKEWSNTRDDVESFVGTAAKSLSDGYGLWKLGDQDDDREDSMITSHWEKSKNHKNCQGCQTSFSALARFRRSSKRGHCRKCGQVFCNGCLGYMRKLNTFAQYDPSGKECKVCKHCHNPETAPVTEGMTISHLALFKQHREDFKRYGWDIDLATEQYRFEPTVSSMLRQCKKLEKGFQGSVSGKSGLKVPNLALMKKNIPDWQKPPTWVDPSNKDITGCQLCSRSKLLPGSLHNCRICGRRVCSQDSSSDFLLYIPDQGTVEYLPENCTRWKIIRIVGCPQTEPAICMYLRVCFTCKGKLSTLQEETFEHFRLPLSDEYELCMMMLQGIHKETQQMKSSILECMPKFIDAVDMLGRDSKNITETQRKSLANHQDNLMDQFPKFIMAVDKLRDITPKTEQQVRLVRNVLQEKWAFYRDNVANFRIRGRQLMEIMPEEEIKQLKYIVNRDAINCACLIVTQLAFEVLHISIQKKLNNSFAKSLKDVAEIIEQELKQMITSSSSGESWEDHRKNLYAYVKSEMQSDRRLLKLTAERREGIERFIYKECERRILSTILQLDAKSSSRSFKKSKQALQSLLAECHNKLT